MSSDAMNFFTKDNLDMYLKELAKEYRRRSGKSVPAEIVLIGGAAILANYGFRNMTTDVDAVIHAASSMKDAINCVRDKFGLPNGWINSDFMHTVSYSSKLEQYSIYYKTFSNVLTIRTVAAEYLIAMKLRSGRKYKNDLSDVIGILAEHEKQGIPISAESINIAVRNLYGSWDQIPKESQSYIQDVLRNGNYEQVYTSITIEEQRARDILINFDKQYPGVTNTDNANNIIANLKMQRESKVSVLEQLREKKAQLETSSESKHVSKLNPER